MDSACVRTLSGGDDVATLLALLTTRARQHHDGHYTILAFTTGYKVAFGTPDIYPGGTAYAQVQGDATVSDFERGAGSRPAR